MCKRKYANEITVTDIKYETLYDSTLRTFALMKVEKIYDVWKRCKQLAQSEPSILNRLEMAAMFAWSNEQFRIFFMKTTKLDISHVSVIRPSLGHKKRLQLI
jgi:hypothetical protein